MKYLLALLLLVFSNDLFCQKEYDDEVFAQALIYQQTYEFSKAIETYTELLAKDTVYEAYYNRGMCYLVLQKNALALNDLLIALPQFDDDFFLNHMIAGAYMLLDDYKNATLFFDRALKYGLVPDAFEASHIGTCYYFDNQPDSAMKYLEMAFEEDVLNTRALTNMGWVYLENGSYEKAKTMFEKCLSIEKDNPSYLNNLGFAYFKLGDIDKGKELILKSKELDDQNSFVYRNLALIYKEQGKRKKACKNYQIALSLNIVQKWGEKYVKELIGYCE